MALGKEGLKARHLFVRQPEKVAHIQVSLRSLNHADGRKSMGPDPRNFAAVALSISGPFP